MTISQVIKGYTRASESDKAGDQCDLELVIYLPSDVR